MRFEMPSIEVVNFSIVDVITTSEEELTFMPPCAAS